jgi:Family of unknown function (DUF5681)
MPFQPGQSGNPAGRPPGARNKRSIISDAMFEGEADALVRRAVDQGLDGDLRAIRLILDRLEPARKDRYIDMRLPPVKCAKDSIAAFEAISSAVAQGELTPLEANAVSSFLDRHVRAIESATFEDRLSKLEQEAKPATGADL